MPRQIGRASTHEGSRGCTETGTKRFRRAGEIEQANPRNTRNRRKWAVVRSERPDELYGGCPGLEDQERERKKARPGRRLETLARRSLCRRDRSRQRGPRQKGLSKRGALFRRRRGSQAGSRLAVARARRRTSPRQKPEGRDRNAEARKRKSQRRRGI